MRATAPSHPIRKLVEVDSQEGCEPQPSWPASIREADDVYARARNRYRDTPVLGKDVGAKVRKLIDDHVVSWAKPVCNSVAAASEQVNHPG